MFRTARSALAPASAATTGALLPAVSAARHATAASPLSVSRGFATATASAAAIAASRRPLASTTRPGASVWRSSVRASAAASAAAQGVGVCRVAARTIATGSGARATTAAAIASSSSSSSSRAGVIAAPIAVAAVVGMTTATTQAEAADVTAEADRIYDTHDKAALLAYLVEQNEANPDEAGILWRLARAEHDVSIMDGVAADRKKELVYSAHAHATAALALDDADFAVHKWFAITLKDLGDYEGSKVSLQNAYIIREHFEKAIELNPSDATSHYLMGAWCFYFADMPWYLRKVAGALFATPPSSTYEEAMSFFEEAEARDPGFYKENALMLAKCFAKLGRKEEAREWREKALAMPVNDADDAASHKEAQDLKI